MFIFTFQLFNRHRLEWHPDFCNRFHIVNKQTGEVLKTEFLSFAAFYGVSILNAYEDGNNNVSLLPSL